jgi:hypothetical protein
MPKLSPKDMQAALAVAKDEFKKKFTPGFYHGSPSPNIKEFDPTKSAKDPMYITPKATFVTRDPEFAESFLSMNNSGKVKSGSTMYPVSVNLGQHWNPNTPEGQAVISDFIEKYPKRAGLEKGLKRGDWTAIENADFLSHLKDTGHDTFHVMEGGVPNVGVLKPENIRGKFAEYDPEHAADPDFMKADGGFISAPYSPSGTALNKMPAGQPVMGGMTTMPNQPVMSFPQSNTPKPMIGPHVLPVQHFDIGGGVKKALQYARSVPFVHFSHNTNISRLEPSMYGTGIKGKEADRLKDAPDIKPRSYFYVKGENVRPEQGLGPHKYEGVAEGIYPLHEDPAGYSKIAKELAKDPYFAKMGVEIIDQPKHLNELERQIKNAGYSGYASDNVGLLFNPTDVIKVTD